VRIRIETYQAQDPNGLPGQMVSHQKLVDFDSGNEIPNSVVFGLILADIRKVGCNLIFDLQKENDLDFDSV